MLSSALGVVPDATLDGSALAPPAPTPTALVHSYAPEDEPVLAEESRAARREAKRQRKLARLAQRHSVQNRPHTEYLLNRLKQLLPIVEQREREENAAYDAGEAVRQGRQGFAQLMQSDPNEGVKFIPYDAICDALAQDNYNTLLGQEVDGHLMAVKGNRESATLKQAIKDLEDGKLSLVPFDGGKFFMTPGQRLWAMMHNQAVTGEDIVCFVQLRNQPESQIQLVRPAGSTSDIFFDNVTPGSGKTALSLIKALTSCVSDAAWEQTQAEWRKRNETGRSINGLGLVQKRGCTNRTLARVVVVYVPDTLVAQWEQHAKNLEEVFKEFTRKSFIIWTGQRVEQRETQTQHSIPKNMTEAQRKTVEENRALLWILVAEPSATKLTTLHDPSIAYVSRIFDEVAGTRMTEPRSKNKRESEVLFTEVEKRHGEAAPGGDERAGHAPHPPRLWRREAQLRFAGAHGDHAPRVGPALGAQPAVVRDATCHAARRPDHELPRQDRVARGQDARHLRHADHHGRPPARPHDLGPAASRKHQAVRQDDEGASQEGPDVQWRGRRRLHRPDAQGGGRGGDAESRQDDQARLRRRRDPADDPGAKAGQRQAQGGGQVLQRA